MSASWLGSIAGAQLTASGLPPGQTARSVRRSCIVAAKEVGLSADGEAGLAQIMGNSARQWEKAYDVRLRDRRAEQGRAAWTAVVSAGAGAGAGAAPSASEEEEAEAEGGGGRELALVPPPAKRQRNERLDAMLAEKAAKAAKKAAVEARKLAIKEFSMAVATVKRERGRPCGWTMKADAPELLSAAEFDQLSTKDLQALWADYYEGGDTAVCKSGNRNYLRRKLVQHAAESSTMTSGGAASV